MIDFTSLKTFIFVAKEGNLSRAADKLHLTQPALSLQMKKLQDALGVTLFERTSRGMRLTDAGRRLLPSAEKALQAATEFTTAASGLNTEVVGRLRLGTILDPSFLRLGRFLGMLTERHPVLSFDLKHGVSGVVTRMIENGELDVSYTLGEINDLELESRFHVLRLTTFSYRIVAPPTWGDRVKGKGWKDIAKLPWIGTPQDSIHYRLLSRIFKREGVQQNIVALVDLEPSMIDLVQSGVGLSLSRHSIALQAAHTHGVVIADSVSVEAELCFICKRERVNEPVIKAALTAITDSWLN